MSIDWTDQSIALFFAEYVASPDLLRSTWGFYEYLPAMYSASSSIHLKKAVEAVALVHMANTSSIDRLTYLARRAYGKSLTDMATAMRSKPRATADETLAALSLLATYEIVSGEQPLGEMFYAHFGGQAAVLRMRGSSQFASPVGRSIFAITNRVLLWKDLAERRRPTLALADWPIDVYSSWLGDISARLSARVADMCGHARELGEVPLAERDKAWAESLRMASGIAIDVDRDVQRSFDDAPENWRWRSLSTRSSIPPLSTSSRPSSDPGSSNLVSWSGPSRRVVSLGDGAESDGDHEQPLSYPVRIDVYPTLAVATLWNSIRCTRLHLLQTFVEISFLLKQCLISPPPAFPSPAALRAIVSSTVTDISASVPFLLGDIDALGTLRSGKATAGARGKLSDSIALLWALHKVCRVPGLELGLKAWIVRVLERIGTVGEMRQALNLSRLHSTPALALRPVACA
ncbi:hypothetical protein MMC30_007933 [Trapelia coarctata]|nr:hypothetical protein [Trapelia coarctata]